MYLLIKVSIFLALFSCGKDVVVVEKEKPAEEPIKEPVTGRVGTPISYVQMQGLLNTNCVKCHAAADFMQSQVLLRRSRVLAELKTRNMPPDKGALSDGDRTLMINFFL